MQIITRLLFAAIFALLISYSGCGDLEYAGGSRDIRNAAINCDEAKYMDFWTGSEMVHAVYLEEVDCFPVPDRGYWNELDADDLDGSTRTFCW